MPNAVDVRQTAEFFATFEDNPVVVTTVGCLCVVYVLVVILARRKDAKNQAKVKLNGLWEWEGKARGILMQGLWGTEPRWVAERPAAVQALMSGVILAKLAHFPSYLQNVLFIKLSGRICC
jgi:hypothetical protein